MRARDPAPPLEEFGWEQAGERSALLEAEPASTGDEHWDVFLAALVGGHRETGGHAETLATSPSRNGAGGGKGHGSVHDLPESSPAPADRRPGTSKPVTSSVCRRTATSVTRSPSSSRTCSSLPHNGGGWAPGGGGGANGFMAANNWPMKPSGVQLSTATVPPGRQTRISLTNREIAGELHITARTAGAHLEHIRARPGAGRRSEIAAWVTAIDGSAVKG